MFNVHIIFLIFGRQRNETNTISRKILKMPPSSNLTVFHFEAMCDGRRAHHQQKHAHGHHYAHNGWQITNGWDTSEWAPDVAFSVISLQLCIRMIQFYFLFFASNIFSMVNLVMAITWWLNILSWACVYTQSHTFSMNHLNLFVRIRTSFSWQSTNFWLKQTFRLKICLQAFFGHVRHQHE